MNPQIRGLSRTTSGGRFQEIFRWEVAHHLRRPSTWLYLALLVAMPLLRSLDHDPRSHYNAPVNVAGSTLLLGLLGMLVTAGLFVETAQRDLRWRMDPLFYTAPLRRREYLGGRFLGTLLVNALLLLAIPLTLLATVRMPTVTPEMLGPLRLEAYLLPYLVFLLPGLLLHAAVLYGVTVLTRRSLPGYLAALGLYVLYFTSLEAGMETSRSRAWALLDPTGAVAVSGLTRGWTLVEQNTLPVPMDGLLLWNRLLWTMVGAGMLAFAWRRFRFAPAESGGRRRAERSDAPNPAGEGGARPLHHAIRTPAAPRSFGMGMRVRQLLDVARMGVRQTVLSRDFLLVAAGLVLLTLFVVLEIPLLGGEPLWPLTGEVAADLTSSFVQVVVVLLTVFYAGELVWRERDAGIETVGDALPVPDWVPFAGKFLALAALLALVQALFMATGMVGQALQGWYAFRPGLYLQVLFGMQLVDYLLFAVLALLAHVLVNQKYLGHGAAVLLFVATLQARRFGIEHNLLVYGSDAGLVWSDLNGFGPFMAPFVWFKLYWGAWALLLCVVALLFWVRGTEGGVRARMRLARRRFTRRTALGTAAAALLVLGTGGFVFYNTNVRNEYRTAWETDELQAGYERRYKRFEHAAHPSLADVRLHAELYPERGEAIARGTYRLVNDGETAIDSIHLFTIPTPGITLRRVRFDRPARTVLADAVHGYGIHALARALQPGDSLRLDFELAVAPNGFRNRQEASSNTALVGDFTSLGSWLLPFVGYQRDTELSGDEDRRAHGLPPRGVRPSLHDVRARRIPRISRIRFEGTVGTAGDHVAVLPGALERSWTEGGRRYFHYRAEAPVLNFFALVSAPYAVRESYWKGVRIRVLHHPDHAFNVDRIIRSAQQSLDYFTEQFGPYPHRQVWLTEFPRYGNFARAYGGHFIYSEGSELAQARMEGGAGEGIDLPLATVAHELAHQWWGQQVMGADVQGSQMLSETLAQYSAAMVLQRARGAAAARGHVREMHHRYLNGRGRHATPEVPLMLTTDHAYIHYGKGAVVMYALQDYVGEARVNAALRRLVQTQGMRGPPYATTLDLYRELRAVTPDSLHALLDDLVGTITLWDLQATGARAEPAGGGAYRVTLEVDAAKLRSDSIGNDREVPMDDLVEIGVFAAPRPGEAEGRPLYLRKHRVRSGRQALVVTVPGRPAFAGIDPYDRLIVRHDDALYTPEVKLAEVVVADPPHPVHPPARSAPP
jgi:ABC-2 type transport system permease protein